MNTQGTAGHKKLVGLPPDRYHANVVLEEIEERDSSYISN